MWDYSEKVIDHYKNPRNVGSIENADAIGEAGSLSCGDMLKLYLKVDKNGIITDAKFQTFGCGSAVASSSILTEMIIGKHIDDAKKITNKQIVEALGGLPPEKMHCSVMGHEALEAAIADYYKEDIALHTDTDIICNCFDISKTFLVEEIKANKLKTVEDVTNYTKAGGACGRCRGKIQAVLDEVNGVEAKSAPLTKTQMIIKINNVIEKYIAPELQKDGGNIELIDVDGNKVKVSLKGRCTSCSRSQLTLTHFVEDTLKKYVDNKIEIVQV